MLTTGAGILLYRFWPDVRPTLDGLSQTRPPDYTVLLDNGSRDGSAQAIRNAYPNVSVVRDQ
jgi:GT2 family glycosyltransferase